MGMYLNSVAPYMNYREMAADPYYVDKSAMIKEFMETLGTPDKYICITRPRRFGKTVIANMLAAFFSKGMDSREIFQNLRIAETAGYERHLNRHDVIYIDCSVVPENCRSYRQYIQYISQGIKADLAEVYPYIEPDSGKSLWDLLMQICLKENGKRFFFILDEWDCVFHLSWVSAAEREKYLLFLRSLLKGRAYVELAYMTGILPIVKYSDGSELNMFAEYQMTTMERFSEYFGFTEQEVDRLYEVYTREKGDISESRLSYNVSRTDLREWYDGYHTFDGKRLYNPRSVIMALKNNRVGNYWTGSGAYDSIFYYIQNDLAEVRDDLALMVAGERIPARIQEYAATAYCLESRDQIYSAMVVYGLLTYEDGKVFIPNRELMAKYEELLLHKESLGYIYELASLSNRMLYATLHGDTKTMAAILQRAHDTETPILAYNHETELAAVVNLVYLAARDEYHVEREDKAGKGYVDFIFYPYDPRKDGIILELKVDRGPEEAIRQIKERDYALRFKGKAGERNRCGGRILAVGIGYDRGSKEHRCLVEELGKCKDIIN
ncbi:MAG: ATP-binding protein [Acetatifactor sp.]